MSEETKFGLKMSTYSELKEEFVSRLGKSGASIFRKLISDEVHAKSLLNPESGSIEELLISLIKGRKLDFKTDEYYGIPISIENRKGSYREWYDENTKESGKTYMEYNYGYIRGTEGGDDEQVDVYLGPNKNAEYVYVVKQFVPTTLQYDEAKCFLGFNSPADAKYAYLQHRNDTKAYGGLKSYTVEEFKAKIANKEFIKSKKKDENEDEQPIKIGPWYDGLIGE